MDVIPAIDIINGKCVRLAEGDFSKATEYSADPLAVAEKWIAFGCRWLHLVDLDGARIGTPVNLETISRILAAVAERGIRVSVGGGLRDRETVITYCDLGVRRLNVGTALIRELKEKGTSALLAGITAAEKIFSLDCRDGMLRIAGWAEDTGLTVAEAVKLVEPQVDGFHVTSIRRDGMMLGPDIELIRQVAALTNKPVIAAGGISSLVDVIMLNNAGIKNLTGMIIGKALYEGKISLREAIHACA